MTTENNFIIISANITKLVSQFVPAQYGPLTYNNRTHKKTSSTINIPLHSELVAAGHFQHYFCIVTKQKMEHVFSSSSGYLHINRQGKTLYMKLFGEIVLTDYQLLLKKAEELTFDNGIVKIVDDRSEVFSHSPALEVWFKNHFVVDSFSKMVRKVERVALVRSEINNDQLNSDTWESMITRVLRSNDNLQFASFATFKEAENWIKKEIINA